MEALLMYSSQCAHGCAGAGSGHPRRRGALLIALCVRVFIDAARYLHSEPLAFQQHAALSVPANPGDFQGQRDRGVGVWCV